MTLTDFDRLILEAAEVGFADEPVEVLGVLVWTRGDDWLYRVCIGRIPWPWRARINGVERVAATAAMAVGSAIAARLTTRRRSTTC